MNIIILEDEFSLRNNIKEFLELNHYSVEAYADGAVLLQKCNFDADLYILDINVSGADGFEVIKWITSNATESAVIFMTAFTDIQSISKAYELGCKDYLKKPFDLIELHLRIKNLLHESNINSINIGSQYRFDMQSKQLLKSGELVKLSKTQKNILYILLEHKNEIVTYDMLIDYVWGNKYIKHNTIASNMREIRHSVPELLIESVRSEGYILKID